MYMLTIQVCISRLFGEDLTVDVGCYGSLAHPTDVIAAAALAGLLEAPDKVHT